MDGQLTQTPRKLWEHDNPKSTSMWRFMQEVNRKFNLRLRDFDQLWKWSVAYRADFFSHMFEYQNHIYEGSYTQVVNEGIPVSKLPKWFYGVRMNMAENMLYSRSRRARATTERSTLHKEDDKVAITEVREGNTEVRHITWGELRRRTFQLASAMYERGVREGDTIVMVGGHSATTTIVLFAAAWLGAAFSASSTDMGINGILQRTVQINPKFVFFDDGALYNGNRIDLTPKIKGVIDGMQGSTQFQGTVIIKRFDQAYDTSSLAKSERFENFLQSARAAPPPVVRIAFQDPSMIFFSSGTTGTPKAIVHAVGPLLLTVKKEGNLHRDISPHDVALQYTTTGWIMYFSSVGHLAMGGRAVFYDGSPFLPDRKVLLRVVAQQKITMLGISPRWLGELMKEGIVPKEEFDLSHLRHVGSTGMVLPDQIFEWFYDTAFPPHVQLGNFSGGTDIAGCFVIENPISPLYVGGSMGGTLGTPLAVYNNEDHVEGAEGKAVPDGTPGDLVADAAFPNVPVFLWNDTSPAPGPKYNGAYFSRFKDAWAQGDYCVVNPVTKAIVLLGRSDGVLNPSGVRFGSAEIYSVMDKRFSDEVAESICVGQRRPKDLDERVVLFLLMKNGIRLDVGLVNKIKSTIASDLTKRHVPKFVFSMPEVPVTVNGKKVELPIKHIISGKTIKPSGTLLNPQSLDYFYQFQKIEDVAGPQPKL